MMLDTIKSVLQTTPARWNTLTRNIPLDLLTRKPAASEWSALECLLHLMDTERGVFPVRIKAILAGEDFPAFFPDEEGSQLNANSSPTDLSAEFEALRVESLKVLETVTEADLERTATHAELGVVTMANLLNEWAGHDLMHIVQAERAMMQPFIAGCGAWQVYFEDHVAK